MDKAFMIQRQARDSVQSLQSYMTDLQNWEYEMKRKEAALNGEFEQDLPPVRSKIKKEKPVLPPKKTQKRISASDYQAWDKFDVDKACEEVEVMDVGPSSLDSKRSTTDKMEKLREEALYEKERGNNYVKQEKWNEAISCYNRAIELVKDDAIYYANRGLCHLKKESLHLAESDCTQALKLDPTYVKAYQRRAAAREKLGSLRGASQDLNEVLKLEPQNNAAKKQLQAIKARMGTKGAKSKSSPLATPTLETKPIVAASPKIIELEDDPKPIVIESKQKLEVDEGRDWKEGVGENIAIIKPINKPPHLRSKKPLKSVTIKEIPLGKTAPEKPWTPMKIIEITEPDEATNDRAELIMNTNQPEKLANEKTELIIDRNKFNSLNNNNHIDKDNVKGMKDNDEVLNGLSSPESEKLVSDTLNTEKELVSIDSMTVPVNSVQFMSEWKYMKDKGDARSHYLSIINPSNVPTIFANALESDVLSEILRILYANPEKFKQNGVYEYLKGLSSVKRFSALAMFLSATDKELIGELLTHCRTAEGKTDEDIAEMRTKYEL